QPGCGALGSGLPSVHPGSIVICGSLFGPPGQTAPLASLGQAAHRWNGIVLRFTSDRILRGQWKVPAALERPSTGCVLVSACSHWNSPYRPCSVMASAGTPSLSALVSGRRLLGITLSDVLYLVAGITRCLIGSAVMLLLCSLITFLLPLNAGLSTARSA